MIATILGVHNNVECALDTIDSVRTFVGDKVLLVIDGSHWTQWESVAVQAHKMKGFPHGVAKSPYRNVALGLSQAWEMWGKEVEWVCYTEYDTLFTSSRFRSNLKMADQQGVWMLGNDGHVDDIQMPLVESLVKSKFRSIYYLLGCCQFFNRRFLEKLQEIDFFNKFLSLTNQFTSGRFPTYNGYDISEHLYPTLCRHFGGAVGVFATWDHKGQWHGSYRYYPMRWKPDLDPETENFPEASIMHPLKDHNHPIRVLQREKRLCMIPPNAKP